MAKGQVLDILGHSSNLDYYWHGSPMVGCSVPGEDRVCLAKGALGIFSMSVWGPQCTVLGPAVNVCW